LRNISGMPFRAMALIPVQQMTRARLLCAAVALVLLPTISGSAEPIASASVTVIDGDTIRLDNGQPNIRLVGFDAPETGSRTQCPNEQARPSRN
jgi:endonuclease YncB( thermonuclease family)